MKAPFATLLVLLLLNIQSFGRNVMSWIPVYSMSGCKALLNAPQSADWFRRGMTHVGLQFWVPGDNGSVVFLTDYQFTSQASVISQNVNDFVTWGNTNDVKIMMCLFNMHEDDFDWSITQQVINDYPYETVDTIMKLVNYYNLDGVDIDFEGVGDYASDKNAFVAFLDTLGKALHASGKELSVDMFSTPCYNAPNPSWESAMAPHVDFMNIMGYSDTYEADNTYFGYCPQTPSEAGTYPFRYSYIEDYLTNTQGVASSKLNYGLPSWVDSWGGQCMHEHVLDIIDISAAGGIAIWDLQMGSGGYWRNTNSWNLIEMFKNDSTSAQIRKHLMVCGVMTEVEASNATQQVYYDSENNLIHFSGMPGELYLYSSVGVLERKWQVKAGENISLSDVEAGFYILKFKSGDGIWSEKVSVRK